VPPPEGTGTTIHPFFKIIRSRYRIHAPRCAPMPVRIMTVRARVPLSRVRVWFLIATRSLLPANSTVHTANAQAWARIGYRARCREWRPSALPCFFRAGNRYRVCVCALSCLVVASWLPASGLSVHHTAPARARWATCQLPASVLIAWRARVAYGTLYAPEVEQEGTPRTTGTTPP
jgi:hypothetical protein